MKDSLVKTNILGVAVTSATEKDILEYIIHFITKTSKKGYIVTPNPEIAVYANSHKDFQNILNGAEISLADGVGLVWAGQFLGKQLKARVAGTDLLENLCQAVAEKPITVGFLGGKEGVAERAAERLLEKFPKLKVGFVGSEWPSSGVIPGLTRDLPREMLNQVQHDKKKRIDILFIAYGFPKQEKFMAENLERLNVRMMMGVGGAFDYISGEVPRAPELIRSLGFEWLFRLFVQPWRIKRQLALLVFLWLVLKERIKLTSHWH